MLLVSGSLLLLFSACNTRKTPLRIARCIHVGSSRRLPLHLVTADYQPSKLVKMMAQHQMPATDPEPERLDETQVKTIQTKVDNKLDPAMPVRTRTPSRAVPCGPRAQHEPHR